MTQYQKLRNSSLDTTDLGFLTDTADLPVLGTNETGEIRFLTYENRIFATKNNCIFPVADRFEDFLGLILACGHTDLLCKIPQYTRLRFQRELSRQMRGMKQQMLCNAIQNCFHPTHIADPYGYVQSMAKIPHSKSRQNTTAVQIGSRHWQAQNLQLLDEDATVEVCIRIPGAQVTAYYDRWETIAADGDAARKKAVTDPFSLQTQIRATASGNPIGVQITEQQHWDPLADNSDAAKETLQRLNLDGEDGWIMLKLLLSTLGVFKDASFRMSTTNSTKNNCKSSGTCTSPCTAKNRSAPRWISGSVTSRYQTGVISTVKTSITSRISR